MNTGLCDTWFLSQCFDHLLLLSLVLDALKNVEGSRKCFRLVGGVLVERTVDEVAPSLEKNKDAVSCLPSISVVQTVLRFVLDIEDSHRTEGAGDEKSSGVLVASSSSSST